MLSVTTWLLYLNLTLAVELPLLVFALGKRCGVRRTLVAGLIASGLTHPLLSYVWPLVIPTRPYSSWLWYVSTGETLVVLVEAVVLYLVALRPMERPRAALSALVVSLCVNAASFGVGALTW